ncbi:GMC family oxidoreductase N-terminal domain-containing protein [Amycolatopsis sp. NBC_00345]|uniref:GMC family oxidoreductase n=1 Tax=Amycolatopsis sp. NBC_00345 TaxID=2975955 RepID=UPI002E26A131
MEPRTTTGPSEVADVVIVGGGAAGCVVAGRLAAGSDREIVLLEAGSVADARRSPMPGGAFAALNDEILHTDVTVPQPELGGRKIAVLTGKALGGGSSVNMLAWFQGDPADYDGWLAAGAEGWGWADVRPVFQRIEHNAAGAGEFHGAGGPMAIDFARDIEPGLLRFVAAGEQVGLPVSHDLNGKDRVGVGLSPTNIRNGARHSVVDGYLTPVAHRPGLSVRGDSPVERILIEDGRATGVRLADGTVIRAREKVVLAAGALKTPKLLMLSGVGPAEHLRAHGIDVVADSPGVGQNLHDHPMVPAVWQVHSGRTLLDAQDEQSQEAYRLLGRGPLSAFPTVAAFFPPADGDGAPEVQGLFYLIGLDGDLQPLDEPAVTVTVALLTPRSRGTLRLASADPAAAPIVDPGYLTDPGDLPRLREGVRRVAELMAAPAARKVSGARVFPAEIASDEALDEWIRQNVQTQWHPCGTCRMGTDPLAVVTPRLAVHGVENLMVADNSVMPAVTRGNTHAPAVLIGERAAEFILGG